MQQAQAAVLYKLGEPLVIETLNVPVLFDLVNATTYLLQPYYFVQIVL